MKIYRIQLTTLALLFFFASATQVSASDCQDESLGRCLAFYSARGLLGSGASYQGCSNRLIEDCYSDYENNKSSLKECSLDFNTCILTAINLSSKLDSCNLSSEKSTITIEKYSNDLISCELNKATVNRNNYELFKAFNEKIKLSDKLIQKLRKTCGRSCKKIR